MSGAHSISEQRADGAAAAAAAATPRAPLPSYADAYAGHQAQLKRLPIPELSTTCGKLLEWAAPLLTPEEAEESAAAVKEFLEDPAQVGRWARAAAALPNNSE